MKFALRKVVDFASGANAEEHWGMLESLTGDSLFSFQLPRAAEICRWWLRARLPWLPEKAPDDEALARLEAEYGAEVEVDPLPQGEWERRDPFEELIDIRRREAIARLKEQEG